MKDVLFFFGLAGGVIGRGGKRTGAVVDLVVDDHVEIFLQKESAPIADLWLSDSQC